MILYLKIKLIFLDIFFSDVDDDYEDEEDEGEASFVDKSLGIFHLLFFKLQNLCTK